MTVKELIEELQKLPAPMSSWEVGVQSTEKQSRTLPYSILGVDFASFRGFGGRVLLFYNVIV